MQQEIDPPPIQVAAARLASLKLHQALPIGYTIRDE
jgi:hypothetical protein